MEALLRHIIDHVRWPDEKTKRHAHELLDAAVAGGEPSSGAADATGGAGGDGQGAAQDGGQ